MVSKDRKKAGRLLIEGLDYVGQAYLKSKTTREIAADGVVKWVGGRVLPKYTIPVRYWLRGTLIGEATTTVAPTGHMDYAITGGVHPMFAGQESMEDAADVTGDDLIGRYWRGSIEEDYTPDFDEDAGGLTAINSFGLPNSHEEIRDEHKARFFFKRHKLLGLPANAVFTKDDGIRYTDYFSTDGAIPWQLDAPESARLVAFGACANDAVGSTDWSQILFGVAGNDTLDSIYEELLFELGGYDKTQDAGNEDTFGTLSGWGSSGYDDSGVVNVEDTLYLITNLTVQVVVYRASQARSRIYTPNG